MLSAVPKCNIRVSEKDKNIHFIQKLPMTMCFSSLIATTFVFTLFGLVPYLRLCILVVKVSRSSFEGSQTTNIQSPRYGTNPKSVNTKVVAINELKHIVIGSFCIKWIFLSFLDTRILHFGTSDNAAIIPFWEYLRSFWRYRYFVFCKISVFLCSISFRNISL